jgi:hypothetical protein
MTLIRGNLRFAYWANSTPDISPDKVRRLRRAAFDHFKALVLQQTGQSLSLKGVVLDDQSGKIHAGSPSLRANPPS